MIRSRKSSLVPHTAFLATVIAAVAVPSAKAAERQKILSAVGDKGWNQKETNVEYRRTVQEIAAACEEWGGKIQEGSDTVVATIPYQFITAAICNH